LAWREKGVKKWEHTRSLWKINNATPWGSGEEKGVENLGELIKQKVEAKGEKSDDSIFI